MPANRTLPTSLIRTGGCLESLRAPLLQDFCEIPFQTRGGPMLISVLVSLAMVLAHCGNPPTQKAQTTPSATPTEVSLNRTNDGQRVTAKVGQPIVVTLQTIGPGRYATPQISSHAVRFEGSAFAPPREQNPGGPQQVYRLTATAEGEAQVGVPHTDSNPTVTFPIRVTKP